MGSGKEPVSSNSGSRRTAAQAYAMAIVCLFIGIAVGYLLRGSSKAGSIPTKQAGAAVAAPSLPAAAPTPAAATSMPAAATPTVSNMGQVTPDQLKHMGDKQAEAMLAELRKDPKNPALLVQIGTVYFRTQQFSQAAEYYERAAKIKPSPELFVSLGNSYHYAKSDDRAIEALNHALKLDPKSANALFNLGVLKWETKNDPKSAIECWQRLLKIYPNHPRRTEVESMIARAKQHMNLADNGKTDKPAS